MPMYHFIISVITWEGLSEIKGIYLKENSLL